MIAPFLVLAFAGVDLLGWAVHRFVAPRHRFVTTLVTSLVWAGVTAALAVWASGELVWLPVVLVLGLLWAPLTSAWPIATIGFIGVVAALAVFARVPDMMIIPSGRPNPAFVDMVVAVIAVVLFLGLSANLICRSALEDARRREKGAADVDRRLRTVLERRWGVPSKREGELRGGRLIGPLERWLIAALALVGAQGIVAALMAAKGIVRFPEISKNSGEGSKAEEFLIGSLVSWGLAGAGAALVWSTL